MSATLSRLRELFDDELFIRGPDGLEPTPRALDLAEPVGRALAGAHDAVSMIRKFDPEQARGVFRLGLSEHPLHYLAPALMTRLRHIAPRMALDIHTFNDREDAVRLLDAGEIDAAVGVPVSAGPRILCQDLFSETFVSIIRIGHPAASRDLSVETFAGMEHLLVSPEGERYGHIDRALDQHGLARNVVLTLPSMYAVPALIVETDLIATIMEGVVRASLLDERLAVFSPPLDMPVITFQLLWHRRTDTHAGQIWFRNTLADVTDSIERSLGKRE